MHIWWFFIKGQMGHNYMQHASSQTIMYGVSCMCVYVCACIYIIYLYNIYSCMANIFMYIRRANDCAICVVYMYIYCLVFGGNLYCWPMDEILFASINLFIVRPLYRVSLLYEFKLDPQTLKRIRFDWFYLITPN